MTTRSHPFAATPAITSRCNSEGLKRTGVAGACLLWRDQEKMRVARPNQNIEPTRGSRFCSLAFASHRRLAPAGHAHRSAAMRAQRAKPKSRGDEMIIAPGKQRTSAALGRVAQMKYLPFFVVGRTRRCAKPGRKGSWEEGRLTQGGSRCAPLPWASFLLPLRGAEHSSIVLSWLALQVAGEREEGL